MPVPDSTSTGVMSDDQRKAAAALLRTVTPAAADLGELFASAGHELALVGGPVRDVFLGRPPGDLDLTTDATPDGVLRIARAWADKVWTVGIEFGTVGLRKGGNVFEITTYRSEQYSPRSRKPDVRYGRSLEEDLSRRDFTINAMAARLPGYEIVDPFGGLTALRDRVIRTPGRPEDSFADDPLRMLRAARFAAKLGFGIAGEVLAAMTAQADRLEIVSAERITGELTKLMLTPDPACGIDILVQTGVADQVLPEVSKLRMEVDEHHRHKDVYQHSLTVLRQAIDLEPAYGLDGDDGDLVLRLAALLHDIGKPKTRSNLPGGRVAFHHHEVKGAKMAKRRLTELRFPNDVVDDVSQLVELHLRFHGYGEGEWTDSAVRRYVRDAGPLLTRLHALTRADCTTRNRVKAERLARAYDSLEKRIAELSAKEELDKIRPELDGNDIQRILGIPPGRAVGKARGFLLELRIEEGELGRERVTQELLRWAEGEGLRPPGGSGG
ncbi:MAG: CCA tRNA nucleotidyltransferase [Streptosporangiaceae bacterium]|nr:CCA tRNA nucleotidyltransferase [Streptosporangiaceae bacterium]MBV9856566.1 CCA tRNA nucleotidyltransferase [Streptosporangiaceae bacterium]